MSLGALNDDLIENINKISWPVNEIKIFNEKNKNDILLNFIDENNIRFSYAISSEQIKLAVQRIKEILN